MKYKFVDNVHYEAENDCFILIDFNNSKFYELNASSSVILNCIKEEKDFDEIVQCLLLKYNINIEQAKIDTSNFINKLIENSLVISFE